MNTQDIQRTNELVRATDMCLRASSQLRLWQKRRMIEDHDAMKFVASFLSEASRGGSFLSGRSNSSCVSNLEPLTWTADIQFRNSSGLQNETKVDYDSLSQFIDSIKNTIDTVLKGEEPPLELVADAASFLRTLGRHLGSMADERLRMPSSSNFSPGERYSFQ